MSHIIFGLLLNLIREYDFKGSDFNQTIVLTSTAIRELLKILPAKMITSAGSQVVLCINDYRITIIEQNDVFDADAANKRKSAITHLSYPDLSYEESQKRLSNSMRLTFPTISGNGMMYMDVLRAICGDVYEKSMVDLGCHKAPYTSQLEFAERCYVDVLDRPLDNIDEQAYFIQSDMVEYLKNCNRLFDVAISSDSIEHLSVSDGEDFIKLMELHSFTQIIFTPIGKLSVDAASVHPDVHKSGWLPSYFEDRGWATIIFPNFHPELNAGAFFAFKTPFVENDFYRIKNELNQFTWTK